MSILSKKYHLVDQFSIDQNDPKLALPRSVATELVLLAALMPLASYS